MAKVQRCRFYFDRVVIVMGPGTCKKRCFLRNGKELVGEASVQNTNGRHEYGRIISARLRPCTSTTNDVSQGAAQCNAD